MTSLNFYSDISEKEREAAANDAVLGFQSPWKVGQKYPLVITKATVADGRFDDRELVLAIEEQIEGGASASRGELRLSMGFAVPGTRQETELKDKESKASKGRRASLGTIDKLFKIIVPGYANYEVVTVGKTSIATDMAGNPVKGDERKKLDADRQIAMMRILTAFNEGSHLDMLVGSAFTYVPVENKKNPDFAYHGFAKTEDTDASN